MTTITKGTKCFVMSSKIQRPRNPLEVYATREKQSIQFYSGRKKIDLVRASDYIINNNRNRRTEVVQWSITITLYINVKTIPATTMFLFCPLIILLRLLARSS